MTLLACWTEGRHQTHGCIALHTPRWSGKLSLLMNISHLSIIDHLFVWLHKFTYCSSHILLQVTEHQFYITQNISGPSLPFIAAALHASRIMAWKMLCVAIDAIQVESDILQVPFAALCAVLRGAIVVLETRNGGEDIVAEKDLKGLWRLMTWFAGRWDIGKEYLIRVEQLTR